MINSNGCYVTGPECIQMRMKKPEGNQPTCRLTYDDCRKMVSQMEDSFKPDVFGVEKEAGKVEGILAAVYQDVFGGEVYPSLEEKAANSLYFMIKDHPFADGSLNKRLIKKNGYRNS